MTEDDYLEKELKLNLVFSVYLVQICKIKHLFLKKFKHRLCKPIFPVMHTFLFEDGSVLAIEGRFEHTKIQGKIRVWFKMFRILMAYSHCTGTEPGQIQGTIPGGMDLTEMMTLVQDKERNQDPLFPIYCSSSLYLSQSRTV